MPECQRCLRTVTENDLLTCRSCKDSYHYQCLNMLSAYYLSYIYDLKRKWRCELCVNVTERKEEEYAAKKTLAKTPPKSADMECEHFLSPINEGTNIAQTSSGGHPVASQISPVTLDQIAQLLDSKLEEKLDSKLKTVEANLGRKIKNEFDKIRAEFSKSIDYLSGQINDVKSNVSSMEGRLLKLENENAELKNAMSAIKTQARTTSDATALKNTIVQLHSELNERDQVTLMNDVEITGVPEFPGESVANIVISTAAKLGIQLDARDIVLATREGAARGAAGVAAGAIAAEGRPAAGSRPRRIVLRLARQALRDDFLRAARVRRNVDTSDLGLPQHVPVRLYINERLTRANRVLLGKAREAKRDLGWRFVWTKEGRIYARRDDTPSSRAQRLRNEDDLERVFGVRPNKQTE